MSKKRTPSDAVSGIILSGGSSNRFQIKNQPWQDKALLIINGGETLLVRTIRLLANSCSEIIIVANNADRKQAYQQELVNLSKNYQKLVSIIIDNPRYRCSGPSLGIISSLPFITNKKAIVVPVDMLHLSNQIIEDIISNLHNEDIIIPYWKSSGKIEPLLFAFALEAFRLPGEILSKITRSRADDFHRAVANCKLLPIYNEHEDLADKLFISLNERSILTNDELGDDFEFSSNLFNSKIAFTITRKTDEKLLQELSNFLSEFSFMKFGKDEIKRGLNLHEQLQRNNMHFYSGLLLHNIMENNLSQKNKLAFSEKSKIVFIKDAEFWGKHQIHFLELHAYTDALNSNKFSYNKKAKDSLTNKISELKQKMSLKKKNHKEKEFVAFLNERAPQLLSKTSKIIRESEAAFNEESPTLETDFLWDHSYRVGKIAYQLALKEGVNPLVSTIAAILHDAGKFVLGKYHDDNIPEEEHSASIANKLLKTEGFDQEEIKDVLKAISALYNEDLVCDINCKIVHDADRLDKLGPLGIANFFTKSTLRGLNLHQAILTSLSRELTYAKSAPKTMMTSAARNLAQQRSATTLDYFNNLLLELKTYEINNFYTKNLQLENHEEVILVIPEKCQKCSGNYLIDISKEKGIKCEKLIANYSCNNCDHEYRIAFCLPILTKKE
ncbi:MAG: NTP transferase domain-containing protein [Candidatus Heimdallarchaeota archaeon]